MWDCLPKGHLSLNVTLSTECSTTKPYKPSKCTPRASLFNTDNKAQQETTHPNALRIHSELFFSLFSVTFFLFSTFPLSNTHTHTHTCTQIQSGGGTCGASGGRWAAAPSKKIPRRQEYLFAPPPTSWTKATDVIFQKYKKRWRERQMIRLYLRGQQNKFFFFKFSP